MLTWPGPDALEQNLNTDRHPAGSVTSDSLGQSSPNAEHVRGSHLMSDRGVRSPEVLGAGGQEWYRQHHLAFLVSHFQD